MPDPHLFLSFDVLTFTLQTTCKNALVRVSKSRNHPAVERYHRTAVVVIRMPQTIAEIRLNCKSSAPYGDGKFIRPLNGAVFFAGVDKSRIGILSGKG